MTIVIQLKWLDYKRNCLQLQGKIENCHKTEMHLIIELLGDLVAQD